MLSLLIHPCVGNPPSCIRTHSLLLAGTKLFGSLTFPLIKWVIISLHCSVVTLDWSNQFSQMTRCYGLAGMTAVPCLLPTKASRRERARHTYFQPLKDTFIFILCSLAWLGKPRILVFKYCKWFLVLEAIDLNTKPSSVYIWDISLGKQCVMVGKALS